MNLHRVLKCDKHVCSRNGETRGGENFWEDSRVCIEACEGRERVLIFEDVSARGGDSDVKGVGKFGVLGIYENGRKLNEL